MRAVFDLHSCANLRLRMTISLS